MVEPRESHTPHRHEPDERREEPAPDVGPSDVDLGRMAVYGVVTVGALTAMISVLMREGAAFDLLVPLLALAAAGPYLLFARLALRQGGPESLVAGLLLLVVGTWGYFAVGDARIATLVLAGYLALLVLGVFIVGGALRALAGQGEVAHEDAVHDRRERTPG